MRGYSAQCRPRKRGTASVLFLHKHHSSHDHGSLVQPTRLTRCLAVPGKTPVVRPENSGYQFIEDDLLTRSK